MKGLLKLEELAEFILGIFIFSHLDFAWWYFPLLLLSPDIGMLGYLVNPKIGACLYNLFHHKALAIMILAFGFVQHNQLMMMVGTILFSHAAFDRAMGYGLKYEDSFANTHLGKVGKERN
ncbi:DUF4260 domain-containing protein [Arcicella sp. LKC2W]|uniref:DUF4260 domain-containing protein n=1 Tax=Arcicella sp. LKC2W TaxID=2984198 RepID=UPI002B205E04|nr:DUF4260 domain-containing protein [Arcicella sp. LKC2W]MEA5460523.1 DUF4260 domain-containing protein [Arcicella sp. LKC2W]